MNKQNQTYMFLVMMSDTPPKLSNDIKAPSPKDIYTKKK